MSEYLLRITYSKPDEDECVNRYETVSSDNLESRLSAVKAQSSVTQIAVYSHEYTVASRTVWEQQSRK